LPPIPPQPEIVRLLKLLIDRLTTNLEKCLEVWAAGREDHFVSLASLTITSQSDVSEASFSPKILEGANNVGVEVIPTKTELLLFLA